ncbi:hypothetical protein [Streptomyces sp. NPDC058678]|uniref:hypothetical protein n=1 Tax=Streptomyces sp. NPDC058678 TaxID=3346595 RepID=UPI0036542567
MGNRNGYPAQDGAAPDRWAGALHLFDNGVNVPHQERVLERWERAQLLFEAPAYLGIARLLAVVVEDAQEQTGPGCCVEGASGAASARQRPRGRTGRCLGGP